MFDFHSYLRTLTAANRLCASEGYQCASCSGIESLQGAVDKFQKARGLVLSDDTATGKTVREGGGGWFSRRTFTVFVLRRHTFGDEKARAAAMDEARELTRQFQSRFLRDRDRLAESLVFLRCEDMPLTEVSAYFATGFACLYFMATVEEPVSLVYQKDEWSDETPPVPTSRVFSAESSEEFA